MSESQKKRTIRVIRDRHSSYTAEELLLELSHLYDIACSYKDNNVWLAFPPLLQKVEQKMRRKYTPVIIRRDDTKNGADPTGASTIIDLSSDCYCHHNVETFFIIAREGEYTCPILHPALGWGSFRSRANSAKIQIFKRDGDSDEVFLLGEGEVRTYPAAPALTAADMRAAAAGLIAQNVLDRTPIMTTCLPKICLPFVSSSYQAFFSWVTTYLYSRTMRTVNNKWRGLGTQWALGLLRCEQIEPDGKFPWKEVVWHQPPREGIEADPCVIVSDKKWIFYEQILSHKHKGKICVAEIDDDNNIRNSRTALQRNFHLSFPQVFKVEDKWYLLPEQSQSGTTMLYECAQFPDQWKECAEIVPGFPGIDPVLFHHNGLWWLFVTYGSYCCQDNNLHIFFSTELKGRYLPHPKNPIKTGLYGSRMAGSIWEHGGRYFRLAQDCVVCYGNSIVLYEIKALSTTDYEETEIVNWGHNEDLPFNKGFHTFSKSDGLVAIDGLRYSRLGDPVT